MAGGLSPSRDLDPQSQALIFQIERRFIVQNSRQPGKSRIRTSCFCSCEGQGNVCVGTGDKAVSKGLECRPVAVSVNGR